MTDITSEPGQRWPLSRVMEQVALTATRQSIKKW
jgi:hypothetical protein